MATAIAPHLNQDLVTRLATDSDFADEVRFYGELYLKHRRLAAVPTPGYTNGYAFAAYGRDLAELLGVAGVQLCDLPVLVEAALAVLDAPVTRLVESATTTGAPALTALAYCVYGPTALVAA